MIGDDSAAASRLSPPASHSNPEAGPPPSPRRWRVALAITELDAGGAERQFVELAKRLDRSLFEPEVVCLAGEGPLVRPLREAGVPVTCLNARGRADIGVVLRLARHLKRLRPDLLQTFLFHANIAGRLAARLAGVPVVVSGIRVAERRSRWRLRLDRATNRFVDRHVCVSRDVAEFSTRVGGLPADKLVVIPNGVDAERFATAEPADLREFGIEPGTQTILFVGRLDPQKDPLRLVEAFRLLAADRPDVHLLLVGRGPLEAELRRAAADADRIHFAGERGDVPNLMRAATCLALPSRWEGMPNVILEALAAGLPVIATDAEGVRETLGNGRFGTIVSAAGPEPLAAALAANLAAGAEPETRLSAQVHIAERFSLEAAVRQYERLYLELLRSGRSATIRMPGAGPPGAQEKNSQSLQSQPR